MKRFILFAWLVILSQSSNCQTWTIHAVTENTTSITALGPDLAGFNNGIAWGAAEWFSSVGFDYGWDVANPAIISSGVLSEYWDSNSVSFATVISVPGFQNTLTCSAVYPDTAAVYWSLSGGYPDYFGSAGGTLSFTGGEFWIDFDPSTTSLVQVGRISNSQPSDFGKYLWDGSVNPNYVAPLLVKKHHGRKT